MNILGLAGVLCFTLALIISGVVAVLLVIDFAAEKSDDKR